VENPARRSFFRLLKLKREGRLPPFMTRISAPGYRKKRKSRTLWTIVRKDQYEMSGDRIIIKMPWRGRLDRSEIQGPDIFKARKEDLRYAMTMIEGSGMLTLLSQRSPRRW
jgi:hypothetical protein